VVEVTYSGHRADLVLKRPEVLNAMNWDIFEGLAAATDEIAARDDVRVVVVSGEGRSFCSGIDTSSFGQVAGDPDEMIAAAQSGFRRLASLAMPTIARVHGHALGAGLQLALACDLRVVAEDATLGILERRFALVPDLGGTQRLSLLVGPAVAKKMIWLGERIDGAEAYRRGLAEVVVPADDLERATNELAEGIASGPPLTARKVKELVDIARRVSLDEGMDGEARAQKEMFASADFSEAISAFMEKRDPNYTGS
jgi:Enoyl-CoA hydratase/carnithine racemase